MIKIVNKNPILVSEIVIYRGKGLAYKKNIQKNEMGFKIMMKTTFFPGKNFKLCTGTKNRKEKKKRKMGNYVLETLRKRPKKKVLCNYKL